MSMSETCVSVDASKNWILLALLAVRIRFGPPGQLLGSSIKWPLLTDAAQCARVRRRSETPGVSCRNAGLQVFRAPLRFARAELRPEHAKLLRPFQPFQRLRNLRLAGDPVLALLLLLLDHTFRRARHEVRIVELDVNARDVRLGLLHFLCQARAFRGEIDHALERQCRYLAAHPKLHRDGG